MNLFSLSMHHISGDGFSGGSKRTKQTVAFLLDRGSQIAEESIPG